MFFAKFTINQINSCKNFFGTKIDMNITHMRSFLINKNLCFYYWLKKRIGKDWAFRMANTIESAILVFGREQIDKRSW